MKRSILFFVVFTIVAANCFGQKGWRFRNEDYVGVANGERGSYGQVRTLNGFSRSNWFLGVETGLDYYGFSSIPLLLSVARDLPIDKGNGLFFYANAGTNVPFYLPPKLSGGPNVKFRGGPAWGAGLGYAWKLSAQGSTALLFSAGYSFKKLKEEDRNWGPCLNSAGCPFMDNVTTYNYLLRSWLFRVGLRF